MLDEEITRSIIGSAMRIHSLLGPGLLESAYREFLYAALVRDGWQVEKEKSIAVYFDGTKINQAFRIDLLVDNKVVVELKAVEDLAYVHFQQVLTYLRLGNYRTGLLINFNVEHLRDGLKRIANSRQS